jgi:hypothetical protein
VWAVGILLALLNVTRGAWFVRAFGRTCAPVTQPRLLVAMRRAEQRLRFRWSIPLQSSALAVAPLVVGLWHPRIVIPDRMEWDLDDHQLVDVFVHELAHLKRRDHWIGALQRAATICYWWNPLVRWVSCLISDLRRLSERLVARTSLRSGACQTGGTCSSRAARPSGDWHLIVQRKPPSQADFAIARSRSITCHGAGSYWLV